MGWEGVSGISDAPTREAPIPTYLVRGNYMARNRTYGVTMKHTASNARASFNELVDSIDELLKRISDIDSPEINKIRTKVQIALSAAKSAWQDTSHYTSERVANSLRWPTDQVRESPWRAVGIATVVGIGMGALLTRPRGN
jgi:ElaB/YqjD/DUF883 family membrane-anchored ribosome-binding protein